jgi:hypothetical protein
MSSGDPLQQQMFQALVDAAVARKVIKAKGIGLDIYFCSTLS